MKRTIYRTGSVLAISLLLLNGCKKEDKPTGSGDNNTNNNNNPSIPTELTVDEDQNSLFVDLTATWCGPCGANGTPMFKKVLTDLEDKAVGLAFHTTNSDLTPHYATADNVYASKLFSNMFSAWNIQTDANGSYGIPSMVVNATHYKSWSESIIKSAIETKALEKPLANVALKAEKSSDGGIHITTKTKFFKDATGEYKLGLYVVSKEVDHRQYVSTSGTYVTPYTHKHVLRASVYGTLQTPTQFGTTITKDPAIAGTEFKIEADFADPKITYPANTSGSLNRWTLDRDNTEIVAIIWKRNGSKHEFVNVQRVDVK